MQILHVSFHECIYTCKHLCNSDPYQDTEHFQHPRKFLHVPSQSVPAPKAQEATTDMIYFFTIDSLPVMEHVNGTGQNRDFCLCLLLLGKMCRDLFVVCIR